MNILVTGGTGGVGKAVVELLAADSNNLVYFTYRGSEEKAENLIEYNSKWFGGDAGSRDFWICFDFKNMEVEISDYSVQSSSSCCIKNWVFEISDDGDKWTKINEHSNYTELNGNLITKTFEVSQKHFARFCRLRNNGEYYGCHNNYSLVLNSIEFYGGLTYN